MAQKKKNKQKETAKERRKRILNEKYERLKLNNPNLTTSEIDKLFVKQQQEYEKKQAERKQAKELSKRAKARERNAKNSKRGQTGKSVRTIQGGGVSPR